MTQNTKQLILRNIVFGVQDSFGSTVGFLSGIAVSGVSGQVLLLSGVVLIFVEAFSMGIGSIISEHSVEEYRKHKSLPLTGSLGGGMYMFVSYLISGFIPLAPYYFFWGRYAVALSIAITILALILLGYLSAKWFGIRALHHIKEMLVIGILAICVGVIVGKLFPGI